MTSHVLERRYHRYTGTDDLIEFRDSEDGKNPVAVGYAAVFGRRSLELRDSQRRVFQETIDPGAFGKTMREADVLGLWNHDTHALLGRTSSGTVRLSTDERGLRYEIDLPDTTTGRDVAELLRRRDIRGSSFGFRTIADKKDKEEDGTVVRTLLEVALIDVSPVSNPAYPDTEAGLRSVAQAVGHDIVEVRAALAEHRFADLVLPVEEHQDPPEEEEGERRAEPTFSHRRLSWAY